MGLDIPKYQNEINSRLDSLESRCNEGSSEELEDKIYDLFSYSEIKDINGNENLKNFFEIQKNRTIKNIILKNENDKKIRMMNIHHNRTIEILEQNAQKQAYEQEKLRKENEKNISLLNEQHKTIVQLEKNAQKQAYEQENIREENEKNIALLTEQHKTIVQLEKNAQKQADEFRNEQKKLREENAKNIALLNEQHNETIVQLEKNAQKQADEFRNEQKKLREENAKNIALLNEQHNETIVQLEKNAQKQADEFRNEQEKLREENAKNIALLNEKHNKTIVQLEKNAQKQADEFRNEQEKIREENAKNIALLNEQHNKTVEMLKQKILEQEERQKMREQKYKEENERKEKEANAKIASLIEQHNNNIKSLEKNAREQVEKFNEQQQLRELQFKNKIEEMEKKYKEERDEEKKRQILLEQKKLEELNEKKKKTRDEFENQVKDILKNKIEEIMISFNLNADKFCLEDISKFDMAKIKILLKELLKFEKVNTFIMKQLYSIIEGIKPKNVEHLNIILVGPSGVGKSTLINAILELEKKTETGFGKPKTQKIDFFTSDKISFLRLADSKGIEKNIDSGTDATYESIKEFINKQIETGDPDKYIHCIWYCWTGARLEQSEKDILIKLSQQYTLDTIPVISVYTNAINKTHIIEAKKYLHNDLKLNIEFVEVLSVEVEIDLGEKIIIKPSFGLDKLKEISIKLAKSAINSACYEGLMKDIENNIKSKLSDLNEILNVKINSLVKEIISHMNEESKLEDFYKKYISIILNVFYKYIFIDPEIKVEDIEKPEIELGEIKLKISEEIIILIKDFINDYFNECMKSLDSNINIILKEQTEKISKEIYAFQLEYNVKHENLLDIKTNLEMENIIKAKIYDKIYKKAKLVAFKNCFIFLAKPLNVNIGKYFNNLYKLGMGKKDFKEKINEIIKIPFNIIEEKIKEYEEKKKKEEEEKKRKEEEKRRKEEEEKKKKEEDEQNRQIENDRNNIQEAPTPTPTTPINIEDDCADLMDDKS